MSCAPSWIWQMLHHASLAHLAVTLQGLVIDPTDVTQQDVAQCRLLGFVCRSVLGSYNMTH